MVGLYIFGAVIVVGMVALVVLKTRSNRTARVLANGRAEKIERERIEAAAKTETRGKS